MTAPVSPCPPPDEVLATVPAPAELAAGPPNGRHDRITVVIPTKNEARNLPWVLRRLPPLVDEVVIVDGQSTDDTIAVARSIRPDVVVVHETRPGKGAALRAGFAAATGDIVVMIDGDGSMDPVEIERYVRAVRDGAHLAKGSRRLKGGGSSDITVIRHLGNRGLLVAANLLLGTAFSELCYGYMALRRTAIAGLGLMADGFEIETEIVARAVRAGHVVVEVPSFEYPRRSGASNLNATRDGIRIVATLLRVRLGLARQAVQPEHERALATETFEARERR